MKFTIDRAVFGKALDHIHGVIEQRQTQDLLSYMKVSTFESGIEITSTDREVFVKERVDAEIATAGEIILPAKLTHDIVRKLPDGVIVEISMTSSGVTLIAGKSRFNLNVLEGSQDLEDKDNLADSFPTPDEVDFPTEFNMSAAQLNKALKIVKLAISTDTMRYYLNGVYMHHSHESLCFVATDGHRLAYFAADCPKGAETMPPIIIPRKAIAELLKLCENFDEDIAIKVSENLARFDIGSITLTSKLIGGEFPDYQRVIPQDNDKKMQVDSRQLRKTVDRVNIFSDVSYATKLTVGKNVLQLSTRSQEAGEASDELEVSYDDEALEIGYNAKYLIEIADNINGMAEFSWLNSSAATIIRDMEDDKALYVLMPMRV